MNLLNNQKGVAIFIVLATIALAVPIVYNFTEETYVNRFKADNIETRARARHVAESALRFAMARLRLYKEAYNFLQNKPKAKDVVKQQTLDMIWNFPFVYPIPQGANMNLVQKEAIRKFHEENFLDGSFTLTINNISNKINLNLMRISLLEEARKKATRKEGEEPPEPPTEEELRFTPETQLFLTLQQSIDLESRDNDFFESQYFGMDIQPLVNQVKFYLSDPNSIQDNGGVDRDFDELNLIPKLAPMTSMSEIYTLPGWDDELVNLISDEFTVHGALMIDLNQINDTLMRLLIPDILDEDIQEFFNWKNEPEDPKFFNDLKDFKNYIVNIGNIMTDSDFDERFNNFKKQGLNFGPTPTLFKVVINAQYGASKYNLTAFVTMPVQPQPRPVRRTGEDAAGSGTGEGRTEEEGGENEGEGEEAGEGADGTGTPGAQNQKTLLLEPRVVEIIVG